MMEASSYSILVLIIALRRIDILAHMKKNNLVLERGNLPRSKKLIFHFFQNIKSVKFSQRKEIGNASVRTVETRTWAMMKLTNCHDSYGLMINNRQWVKG